MEAEVKPKKKYPQGPKKGKVVRLSDAALAVLNECRRGREALWRTADRLLGADRGKKRNFFILLENALVLKAETLEKARGEAILVSVKTGKKEKPVEVREL